MLLHGLVKAMIGVNIDFYEQQKEDFKSLVNTIIGVNIKVEKRLRQALTSLANTRIGVNFFFITLECNR